VSRWIGDDGSDAPTPIVHVTAAPVLGGLGFATGLTSLITGRRKEQS